MRGRGPQTGTVQRHSGGMVRWPAVLAAAALTGLTALGTHAAAPRKTVGLASRIHLRLAPADVLSQCTEELSRAGWTNIRVAAIPSAYQRLSDTAPVEAVNTHPATLYGDVDGDGKPEWVLGLYWQPDRSPFPEPEPAIPGTERMREVMEDDRARVAVFKQEAAGRWKLAWRSPGLGYSFREPVFNLQEVQHNLERMESLMPPLALVDVDRDGSLEVAYTCWSRSESVGALPGVYRWEQPTMPATIGRWVSVAPQSDRFSVQDVDNDRLYEIVTGSRYVGYGTGDNDVPRVWRWTGRQFQEASNRYPQFYAQLAVRYRDYMKSMEASGGTWKKSLWERAYQKALSLAG